METCPRGENNTRGRHNSKPITSARHSSGISPPVHCDIPPEVHLKDLPMRQYSEDFPSVHHQIQSPPVHPQFGPENHRSSANRRKTPRKEQKRKDNKQSPPSFYSTEKSQNGHREERINFDSQHIGNVSSFSEFHGTIKPQNIINGFKSNSLIKKQFASTEITKQYTDHLPHSPKNKDKRKKTKTLEQITKEILHGIISSFLPYFQLVVLLSFC